MTEKATTATKSTQRARVMAHLKTGEPLTALEALREYGIMRLPNRISELRKRGEPIVKTMITVKNKYDENVRVAQYRLEEKTASTTPADVREAAASNYTADSKQGRERPFAALVEGNNEVEKRRDK